MTPRLARALIHLHGQVGWLSAVALAHPALMLHRPRRRVLAVAAAASALVTLAAAIGAATYPAYRLQVKPALFAVAPLAGELFERKEHLGVFAVVLAWAGLGLCALAARRDDDQRGIARLAFVAYAGATAAALASAAVGLLASIQRSF